MSLLFDSNSFNGLTISGVSATTSPTGPTGAQGNIQSLTSTATGSISNPISTTSTPTNLGLTQNITPTQTGSMNISSIVNIAGLNNLNSDDGSRDEISFYYNINGSVVGLVRLGNFFSSTAIGTNYQEVTVFTTYSVTAGTTYSITLFAYLATSLNSTQYYLSSGTMNLLLPSVATNLSYTGPTGATGTTSVTSSTALNLFNSATSTYLVPISSVNNPFASTGTILGVVAQPRTTQIRLDGAISFAGSAPNSVSLSSFPLNIYRNPSTVVSGNSNNGYMVVASGTSSVGVSFTLNFYNPVSTFFPFTNGSTATTYNLTPSYYNGTFTVASQNATSVTLTFTTGNLGGAISVSQGTNIVTATSTAVTISTINVTTTVATVTHNGSAPFIVGQPITISGTTNAFYNKDWIINTVPIAGTFTLQVATGSPNATGGTATGTSRLSLSLAQHNGATATTYPILSTLNFSLVDTTASTTLSNVYVTHLYYIATSTTTVHNPTAFLYNGSIITAVSN